MSTTCDSLMTNQVNNLNSIVHVHRSWKDMQQLHFVPIKLGQTHLSRPVFIKLRRSSFNSLSE